MKPSTTILLLTLSLAGGPAAAADADSSVPNFPTFVSAAAQAGLAEIEVAKLALDKSNDPAIRGFAKRMVQDHSKANADLAQLAFAKGIIPPAKLDAEHEAMLKSLRSAPEADFDRQYSRHMNMGHSKALALFEGASQSPDKDMADFAKKTLPTIKEHRQLAEKLPGYSQQGSPPGGR
jgi:putative membrane protein